MTNLTEIGQKETTLKWGNGNVGEGEEKPNFQVGFGV